MYVYSRHLNGMLFHRVREEEGVRETFNKLSSAIFFVHSVVFCFYLLLVLFGGVYPPVGTPYLDPSPRMLLRCTILNGEMFSIRLNTKNVWEKSTYASV